MARPYMIKLFICFQKRFRGKRRGAGLLHRRGWDALFIKTTSPIPSIPGKSKGI